MNLGLVNIIRRKMTTVVWNGQNQETDGTLILKFTGKINTE
jgi:hypothetical protein